jgi:hypothetical protein
VGVEGEALPRDPIGEAGEDRVVGRARRKSLQHGGHPCHLSDLLPATAMIAAERRTGRSACCTVMEAGGFLFTAERRFAPISQHGGIGGEPAALGKPLVAVFVRE